MIPIIPAMVTPVAHGITLMTWVWPLSSLMPLELTLVLAEIPKLELPKAA